MSNTYIALNGDSVGERIGQAIAQDNHEELQNVTSAIQNAHDTIDQWVDSIGGKKISGAGDDAIYQVPEQAINDLDEIREQYQQESGHSLTVGVGASMSQASKALIYGKMNGKGQTIHYEPMIEDYLSEEDEDQPEVPSEEDAQDQADNDIEADAGAADLEGAPDEDADVDDSQSAVPGAPAPQDPAMAVSNEDDSDVPPAGTEDDIADDNVEADASPAAPVANQTPAQKTNQAPSSNTPPIDGKTDVDFGTSDEDQSEDGMDASADPAMSSDEDMPDTDPATDEAAQMGNDQSDAMPMDEDQADGDQSMDDSQELSDEDVVDPSQQDDGEDPVASMIHGDMQEGGADDQSEDADMDASQDDGDAALDEELKSDIANALLAFKENKHMLEEARDTNPALYDATLTMLRSMISMAKKLGFAPEQDMADQEANAGLEDSMPEAGAEDMGEDPTEDMPNEEGEDETIEDAGEEAPSDKKGPPPAKK